MTPHKELLVSGIKSGTVIDHIPAGQALKIVRILNLPAHRKVVTIGLNLPSKAMGHKDLVKVEDRELTPEEANQVAIIAPKATINIIRNFAISKKFVVKIPTTISQFVVCPNKNCITNLERMDSRFSVAGNSVIRITCDYCEKVFMLDEVTNYNL